jgi:hypothetical protein
VLVHSAESAFLMVHRHPAPVRYTLYTYEEMYLTGRGRL